MTKTPTNDQASVADTSLLDPESPEGAAEISRFAAKLIETNHDLNNPLAGVIGYLELALSSEDGVHDEVKSLLQSAQLSAEMISSKVKRLSEAKLDLVRKVDLTSLLADRPEVLQ
ncbi:MAG: histidine kinase dimerization/phospho-acceptor domain-containing protein [Candidatus Zixiibacteriota bacterium]